MTWHSRLREEVDSLVGMRAISWDTVVSALFIQYAEKRARTAQYLREDRAWRRKVGAVRKRSPEQLARDREARRLKPQVVDPEKAREKARRYQARRRAAGKKRPSTPESRARDAERMRAVRARKKAQKMEAS